MYKRHCEHLQTSKKDRLDLLSFSISISNALLCCDSDDPSKVISLRKRGRPSRSDPIESSDEDEAQSTSVGKKRAFHKRSVPEEARYDQVWHWPSMVDASKRRRCKVCQKLTQNMCTKCDLPLCISHTRNCFVSFHTE